MNAVVHEPLISYADPNDNFIRRTAIRTVERFSGQRRLQRLYREYRQQSTPSDCVWSEAISRLGVRVSKISSQECDFPADGPVIAVANHPFGVMDGLSLCYEIAKVRRDFRLLAHSTLQRAPEFEPFIIPIDFLGASAGLRSNVQSRKVALEHLEGGGMLVLFPAGRVSTAPKVFGQAIDAEWKLFLATLVLRSKAVVVPAFFEGQNSRVFHLANQFGEACREAMLMHEAVRRMHSEIRLHIGKTIERAQLEACAGRQALVDYLRQQTFALAGP